MKNPSSIASLVLFLLGMPLFAANRDVAIGSVQLPSEWSLVQSVEYGWWHPDQDVVGYHRVPYAEPPLLHKAFHVPVDYDHDAWPFINASPAFNPASAYECIQLRFGQPVGSADCLYLNVFRPNTNYSPWPNARYADSLPVVIWIHGGSMIEGSGLQAPNMLKDLARRGTVVVSMNYRLGILGFATKIDRQNQINGLIDADGLNGTAGNYGLWDQQKAIQWVRDNIDRFGGDPNQISLMGWSAGGYSAMAQASTGTNTTNFQSVVQQSGFVSSSPLDHSVMDVHAQALEEAAYPGFAPVPTILNNPCPVTDSNPLLCWRFLSEYQPTLFKQWMARATEAIENQFVSIHQNFYAVHDDVPGAFFQQPFWTEFTDNFDLPFLSLVNEHEFAFAPAALEDYWTSYWSNVNPQHTYGPDDVGILLNIPFSDFDQHLKTPPNHYRAQIASVNSLAEAAAIAARIWSDVSLCLGHDALPGAVAANQQSLIRRVRLDDAPDVALALTERSAHGFDVLFLEQFFALTPAEKQLGAKMLNTWAAFMKDPTVLVNHFNGGSAVTVFESPGDIHSPSGSGEVRGEYLSQSSLYAGCSVLAEAGLVDPAAGVVALSTKPPAELGYQ